MYNKGENIFLHSKLMNHSTTEIIDMKTEQHMVRNLEGMVFHQRTSDGFFNLNAICEAWNNNPKRIDNGLSEKRIDSFFNNDSTKEFILTIYKEEYGDFNFKNLKEDEIYYNEFLLVDPNDMRKLPIKDIQRITDKKVISAKRGVHGGTWAHPLLFLDFMQWLSPHFKYHALKIVHDNLIEYRKQVGDDYKEWSSLIHKLKDAPSNAVHHFSTPAVLKAYLVRGDYKKEWLQTITEEEARKLLTTTSNMKYAIERGYIKTWNQFVNELIEMIKTSRNQEETRNAITYRNTHS